MAGRTHNRWTRVYVDGRDLSGFSRKIGPLLYDANPVDLTAPMSDAGKGFYPGLPNMNVGTLNALLETTATTGLHAIMNGAGVGRNVMVAIGSQAAPAVGDPTYCGVFTQSAYESTDDGGAVVMTIPFAGYDEVLGASMTYNQPWGKLLHVLGDETGANSGNTPRIDGGASTSLGGILFYHITSITGTNVIISVDDSANGTSWAACSGLTTASILQASAPTSGYICLSKTATIRQYTRFQIAGTFSHCIFTAALVRGQ
jgi:hypothetical protein